MLVSGVWSVVLCIFDLLVQSGRSVMGLTYIERKKRLARLFNPKPRRTLLVVQSIPETGKELFTHAVAMEL